MNSIKLALFGFLLIAIAVAGLYFQKQKSDVEDLYPGYETTVFNLEGKRLKLLVADTTEKQQKGLMNFRELRGVDGMIFTYGEKRTAHYWNQNTLMDLNLYWISDGKVIGKSFLPSIEKSGEVVVVNSPGEIDKVIEIPVK